MRKDSIGTHPLSGVGDKQHGEADRGNNEKKAFYDLIEENINSSTHLIMIGL
jgi:hypothetical protein